MWYIKTFIIFILLFNTFVAQERMILRSNGEQIKLNNRKNMREAIRETKLTNLIGRTVKSVFPTLRDSESVKDTLSYRERGGVFNASFGFHSQDVMLMWFEAPADISIKEIGFYCSDDEGYIIDGATVGLRLIKLNWSKEELLHFTSATYQGYYLSDGNGFNDTDYFGENATSNWISKDSGNLLPPWSNHENPDSNSFNYSLWPDDGSFLPVVPFEAVISGYIWLNLNSTGLGEAIVRSGEIFGVVAKNNGVNLDSSRIGFYSGNSLGYPGWKYYENGRFSSDEPGWWVRMYTWDFAVCVEITGDLPPAITKVTQLSATLSTEPQRITATVIDTNPSGGDVGVAEVNLKYIVKDNDTVTYKMTNVGGNLFEGYISNFNPCARTKYWVEAEDVNGNKSESLLYTFFMFCVSQNQNLLVFNGYTAYEGYPQSYYFGSGDYPNSLTVLEWEHDIWAFGALTEELVNNYNNIIEICTRGPVSINNDVIETWLAGDGNRNYLIAGDEWLGGQYGWPGTLDIPDGDFAKDVVGISVYYSDINYAVSGDQQLPSNVNAVEGSLLGGKLFTLHEQVSADSGWTSSIQYNPTYEISVDNWLDGVDFIDGVEVDMTGIGVDGNTYNIAGHRTLAAGNKIVFLAYDPLSLNSNLDGEYYWYGFTQEAPQVQALLWFDAVVSVNEESELPETFSLSQNYPNPFNPSTTIKYSIPVETRRGVSVQTISLKVYDILGREVATLVNKEQKPGNYEVEFTTNGGLTSGIYFYRLKSGSFSATKKLLLIK